MNVSKLVKFMDELHPDIQNYSKQETHRMRDCISKGQLANFHEGDFVLVGCEKCFEGRIIVRILARST